VTELVSCTLSLFSKAVWAGWGHASENPKLPDLLSKHGITFIGKNFLKIYVNLVVLNLSIQPMYILSAV